MRTPVLSSSSSRAANLYRSNIHNGGNNISYNYNNSVKGFGINGGTSSGMGMNGVASAVGLNSNSNIKKQASTQVCSYSKIQTFSVNSH